MRTKPGDPAPPEDSLARGDSWKQRNPDGIVTDAYACAPGERKGDLGFRCVSSAFVPRYFYAGE